jgi:hypothetical protein
MMSLAVYLTVVASIKASTWLSAVAIDLVSQSPEISASLGLKQFALLDSRVQMAEISGKSNRELNRRIINLKRVSSIITKLAYLTAKYPFTLSSLDRLDYQLSRRE